jgi:hypothetical protein
MIFLKGFGIDLSMMYSEMSIKELANLINKDWKQGGKAHYGALPYLEAMHSIKSIEGRYGPDSARSIVIYFLANASQWKRELASAVKLVLRNRIQF